MKRFLAPLSSLTLAVLLAVHAPASSSAQDTTTTTTTTVLPSPTPAPEVQTQTVETTTTTVQPTPVIVPQPGQHVVEIELAVSRGSVQAYFGQASRGEKAEIGGLQLNIKLPSTATVTKIASRDKTSDGAHKVTADNPWHVVVPFDGGGRFVFNIVEWDDDPIVTAAVVKVDGVVLFSGHGRDDDFDNWPQRTYGPNVRKTGSREIAFLLPAR